MNEQERLSLLNFDKIIIFLFVIFLLMLSGEAEQFLARLDLKGIYLLLLSFGIACVCTPLAHLVAHRVGLVDVPQGRKAHRVPTALLGGVAIYAAFAITVLRSYQFSDELKGVALAGTLIFIVGLLDDRRELPAKLKLLAQVAAVGILVRYGVVISFLPPTVWGDIGEWLLTGFWIIGITNAVNFLDGMDGLAAGICGIMSAFFGMVALQNNQTYMVYLALPLVGACCGFLPYNFRRNRPAAIFLGDAGSTFLGFMVAALAVMGNWGGDHTVRLIVPVIILGVPIFDMTFTTVMRIRHRQVRAFREWIEFTGRDHIHHRLEDLRLGRSRAVIVIYIVTIWLGLSAMALKNAAGINALLQVAQSVIVFLLMAFFMVFIKGKYLELERHIHDANGT